MVNPYFHMFGLKAGILACVAAGATMLPEPVFDVERVLARVGDERVTVLPGAPTLYQAHPRPSRPRRLRPVQPAGGRDRRRRHPGRAHPPGRTTSSRSRVVVTGYGLTEGGHGARPPRPSDDAETIATTVGRAPSGLRAAHRRRREATDVRGRASAGEVLLRGGSVMSHYLDDPDETAEAPLTRTAGCAPATSAWSTTAAACASSAGSRTCSSSAGSTPTPPRSRTSCCAIRTSPRRRSSASPTSASARWAWRSSCARPGDRSTRAEIIAWSRERDGQLQGAAGRRDRRRAAAQRHRQGREGRSCAQRGGDAARGQWRA